MKASRRFTDHKKAGHPLVLAAGHKAIVGGTTLFQKRIATPDEAIPLFKSGQHSRKIGSHVTKGMWKGMPIYTLTLEERATCPKQCEHWQDCFAPETLVLRTDLRWVRIDTLVEGDTILGFDEGQIGSARYNTRRKTRLAVVEKLGRELKPSIKITTSRGDITVSNNHLLLVRNGRDGFKWLKAGEIKPGNEIQFLLSPWGENKSYDAGRMRGFVEGEGCVQVGHFGGFAKCNMGWAQREGQLAGEINQIASELGFNTRVYKRVSGVVGTDMLLTDVTGGWREVVKFLGTIRPTRLLENAKDALINHNLAQGDNSPAIVSAVEDVGVVDVVKIQTNTKTLIANGFCAHNCFGNKMHWSTRWRAGAELETQIPIQLAVLAKKHKKGFVVRLHVLGDFYSKEYVGLWRQMLAKFPQLHVFGYTRRRSREDTEGAWYTTIGSSIAWLNVRFPDRWAIRWSEQGGEMGTLSKDDVTLRGKTPDGIVCPAQTGDSSCCGTCALCWNTTKPIVFITH